jgi:hypothetical protein
MPEIQRNLVGRTDSQLRYGRGRSAVSGCFFTRTGLALRLGVLLLDRFDRTWTCSGCEGAPGTDTG